MMIEIPEKCLFCAAKRTGRGNEYECGSVHDGHKVIYRNYRCYEAEIARLKARCKRLDQVLRRMLLSADCSWEEHNEGHDWRDICEEARALLNIATPEVYAGVVTKVLEAERDAALAELAEMKAKQS